ncbi:hypothetical protein VP01_2759g3 [Puccinia sorghi]|uniref:Uncharacterized protein n=1 Tax=Puccinia sorghi TaxID=27349 RepID=A0A0L6V2X7_9BASI|nr:hypothetical protein VP01_2759g3 [Puccinia sorghi]
MEIAFERFIPADFCAMVINFIGETRLEFQVQLPRSPMAVISDEESTPWALDLSANTPSNNTIWQIQVDQFLLMAWFNRVHSLFIDMAIGYMQLYIDTINFIPFPYHLQQEVDNQWSLIVRHVCMSSIYTIVECGVGSTKTPKNMELKAKALFKALVGRSFNLGS